MTTTLLVPPASEPVPLSDAKAWLRLDTADEDALVTALVAAARGFVEAATRRALVTQTWRITYDAWPQCLVTSPLGSGATVRMPALPVPLAPVASVTALRIIDANGVPQTVAPETYRLIGAPDDARVLLSTPPPPPGRATDGIELDIVAGYGGPADVPQMLRQAMLMLAAHWFENRGDADGASAQRDVPTSVGALLAPFCRPRIA